MNPFSKVTLLYIGEALFDDDRVILGKIRVLLYLQESNLRPFDHSFGCSIRELYVVSGF